MTSRAHTLPLNPAPWAEGVPDAPPMTLEGFFAYPVTDLFG